MMAFHTTRKRSALARGLVVVTMLSATPLSAAPPVNAPSEADRGAPVGEERRPVWPLAVVAYGIVTTTAVLAVAGVVSGLTLAGVNPLIDTRGNGGEGGAERARYQGLAGGLMAGFSAFGLIASFNSFVLVSVGLAGGFESAADLLRE